MATGNTRDFFELVKAIGESKSKQEEDRIVAEEVIFLKKVINQPGNTKKKMKELLVRAMYVEMLGQDASFSYIRAVELCASTNIIQKRVGFLAASVFLSPEHEFRFMLVNQIQRDMNSSNQLEICAALHAVCKLVTEDMIPAVIGDVVKLLRHDMDMVRKKAIGALHRLYQMDKSSIGDHMDKIRRAICDRDPSVMGACLPLLYDLSVDDPASYKDLVPSLVSILKQIIEHRLPREFDYHRIPAPWVQMQLLKILAVLGRGDQAASEGMYEVLVDVMRRGDTGINVGYAIVYETVRTVTTIYPNPLLLDAAATSISRFIRSDSHNLKYIGIKGLAAIVKDHPRYAVDHQLAVIDCLEDPDETLKRKTLDLLFRMTNSVNVEFIVEKLLTFLSTATDDHFRSDLVGQITQCAERFAPSNEWYVKTVVQVFELAGDKVKKSVAQTLLQLIAEGTEVGGDDDDDEEEDAARDEELRTEAVEDFLQLLDKKKLPDILAQSMAWVLGEYGYLAESCTSKEIMEKLCELAIHTKDSETRGHVITAIQKLVAQSGSCPAKVTDLIQRFSYSTSLDVQQRCLEFKALLQSADSLAEVLPVDASCEDIEVDENLSFLDSYVQQALVDGAPPYSPPEDYDDDDEDGSPTRSGGLKMTPYERPAAPQGVPMMASVGGQTGPAPGAPATIGGMSQSAVASSSTVLQGNQLLANKGAAQVWGRKMEPPPIPAPAPAMPSTPAVAGVPSAHTNGSGNTTSSSMYTPGSTLAPSLQSPEPEKERELTEKEKMAANLFGGLSSSSKKPNARRSSTRSAAISAPSNTQTDANPVAPVPSVPTTASAQGQTSYLLDMPNDTNKTISPDSGRIGIDLLDVPGQTDEMSQISSVSANSPPSSPSLPPTTTTPDIFSQPLQSTPLQPSMSMNPVGGPAARGMSAGAQTSSVTDAFASLDMSGNGMGGSVSPSPTAASTTRPLQLTTADFGRRWGSLNQEVKQTVPCRFRALEQLRQAMPPCFHHVESITNTGEAIYAATTGVSSLVLVHVKLAPQKIGCDVTVKSTTRDVCAAEMSTISASFAQM